MNKSVFLTKLEQCSEEFDVKPGVLLNFFKILIEKKNITPLELLYELEVPQTNFSRILKFYTDFFLPQSKFLTLKPEVEEELSKFIINENFLNESDFEDKYLEIYTEITKERPSPKRNLDQFYATPKTILKRALFLHKLNELYRRKILFLGDDDHTSLALALINNSAKIHVVDVDNKILESIEKLSEKFDLNIDTSLADFRYDKLDSLKGKFDVVFTDPPYTTQGIDLFIDKAITCLRLRYSSTIFFCYGNSLRATERTLSIQKKIMEKDLMISLIEKNFNQYAGAESIGNGSSLYGCVITPATKVPKYEKKDKRIYTYE